MNIRYRDRETGAVTMALFERHTMSRTMRRYPARQYEIIGCDLSARPIALAKAGGIAQPSDKATSGGLGVRSLPPATQAIARRRNLLL